MISVKVMLLFAASEQMDERELYQDFVSTLIPVLILMLVLLNVPLLCPQSPEQYELHDAKASLSSGGAEEISPRSGLADIQSKTIDMASENCPSGAQRKG